MAVLTGVPNSRAQMALMYYHDWFFDASFPSFVFSQLLERFKEKVNTKIGVHVGGWGTWSVDVFYVSIFSRYRGGDEWSMGWGIWMILFEGVHGGEDCAS